MQKSRTPPLARQLIVTDCIEQGLLCVTSVCLVCCRGMFESIHTEAQAPVADRAAQHNIPHVRLSVAVRRLLLPQRRHLLHSEDRRVAALQLRVSMCVSLCVSVCGGGGGCYLQQIGARIIRRTLAGTRPPHSYGLSPSNIRIVSAIESAGGIPLGPCANTTVGLRSLKCSYLKPECVSHLPISCSRRHDSVLAIGLSLHTSHVDGYVAYCDTAKKRSRRTCRVKQKFPKRSFNYKVNYFLPEYYHCCIYSS